MEYRTTRIFKYIFTQFICLIDTKCTIKYRWVHHAFSRNTWEQCASTTVTCNNKTKVDFLNLNSCLADIIVCRLCYLITFFFLKLSMLTKGSNYAFLILCCVPNLV